MERVDKILKAENKMPIPVNPIHIAPLKEKIEFKNVSFKYDTKWVLKNINPNGP